MTDARKQLLFWQTPFYVLLCATTVIMIANGSRQNFGLFLVPLSNDLGWGREQFSIALAIQNLVMGLAAPLVAAIADRWGPIKVVAWSGVLYAVGVFLMSISTSPALMIASGGVIVGLGVSGCGLTLLLALVGRVAADRNRSLWLGIVVAGGSAGQFAFAPISTALIQGFGWADGMVILAIIIAIIVPLTLSLKAGSAPTLEQKSAQSLGQALSEASTHRGYWLLVTGFFVCGFQVQFIATHLPGYLDDAGAESWLAAKALATIGLFNILGTLSAGWLGVRFSKKTILSYLYFARGLLFLAFFYMPVTETTVLMFSAVLGILWLSTVPLTSGIVAQVFGPRYMGTLFSITFLSHQLGSFSGVWLGGYIRDLTQTYDIAWWFIIIAGFVAAAIHWPINEKPLARLAEQPG